MNEKQRYCNPSCEFFRCGRKALFFKSRVAWCKFADDACDVKTCKFASCIRNKLLPNGICGLFVKPKIIEPKPEEMLKPIKASGKLIQKIKERELY